MISVGGAYTYNIFSQNKLCISYKNACIFLFVQKVETKINLEKPFYLVTKT